jgi:hypothetical protein
MVSWDIFNLEQELNAKPTLLSERKDQILDSYVSAIQEIANEQIPASWSIRSHLVSRAMEYFPSSLQEALKHLIPQADMQVSYLEQKAALSAKERDLPKRQQCISDFLSTYSSHK